MTEPLFAETAAATIAGEVPTKAMVALKPADPDALAVEGGDPPEALHATLKFMHDAEPWEPERRAAVEEAVAAWAARTPAFTANVGGAGRLGKDDPPASVLFLDVPGLQGARAELAGMIDAIGGPEGIDVADTYDGFLPHLTTGYGVDPSDDMRGTQFPFNRVTVHWGEDVREFPLADPEAVAAALSEADEDEVEQVVNAAETKVAQLEALVASIKMARIPDLIFGEAAAEQAYTAAALAPYTAALADASPLVAQIAGLADDELPEDLMSRVDKLVERLEAIEAEVHDMMLEGVADEEMPDPGNPLNGSFVDETRRAEVASLDEDGTEDEIPEDLEGLAEALSDG